MEIVIGKQWKEKTDYYIKESLSTPSVWLVDAAVKEEYEKMLLEASENKAILQQNVMTFNEFYNDLLFSQQFFKRQVVSPIQSLLVIYEILSDYDGEIIQCTDNGIIQQLHHVFSCFKRYKSNLELLKEVELPAFSKKKLEECGQLYQRYLAKLEAYGWRMKEDYESEPVEIDDTIHFYIDQIEEVDEQMMSLIHKMAHCTILLTCDDQEDAYTHFIKKELKRWNTKITLFDETVSPFKEYLIQSYQNLKAPDYSLDYPLTGVKVVNQHAEIQQLAVEIYHLIASGQAQYSDFAVYCTSQDYFEKIETVFKLHRLPCFIAKTIPIYQSRIAMLVKSLWMYMKTADEIHLITLFRSHLFKGIFLDAKIDLFEKQLKTMHFCTLEDYQEAKANIDQIVLEMNSKDYVDQKVSCLVHWLEEMEVEKGAVDELDRACLAQTMDYFKQFEMHIKMDQNDFLDMLSAHYALHAPKIEKTMDMITVAMNDAVLTPAKRIYILGCNENSFPTVESDNELILNDEYIACEEAGIRLGLNLFERIEVQYLQWFKLLYLEKKVTLSYITGSLGGDDFLPSSLYLSLMKQFKSKEKVVGQTRRLNDVTTPEASLDIALHYGDTTRSIQSVRTLADQYRHNKNQPAPINVTLLEQLIDKNGKKAISPSELETYNGCPFKYYIRYGLGIYPWQDRTLKANDFGTIVHDVLDVLSDLYDGKKTIEDYLTEYRIADVHNTYEENIYPFICESDVLNEQDQGLFVIIHQIANEKIDRSQLTSSQQYLFYKLQHDLFNTVKILIYQMSISDFSITDHEQWIEKNNGEFLLHGRIDRVEQYQQYIKVVDYKSSQKALDLCLATLGFNIQMLLYLDMVCQDKALEKGGVLYFNTKQRVVKMDEYLYEDGLDFEEIVKLYKMEGYINSEETLIKAMDRHYDPSVIANVKFVKSKGTYTGNLLDRESFDCLLEKVNLHVEALLDRIYHQGDIRIFPSHHDAPKINMLVNPCTYCDYDSVCLKDVFYNENNEIEYIDPKTMLKILGGEQHD